MKSTILVCMLMLSGAALAVDSDDEYVAKNGGYVQIKGKGCVSAIDCRSTAVEGDIAKAVDKIRDLFNIEFAFRPGKPFSIATARTQLADAKGNVAVFIIDDATLPISLVASEEKWAMFNVAQLRQDNPSPERLKNRIEKMFMRQCCRILGSDENKSPECVLYPVRSVDDIDRIESLDLSIGPYMAIGEVLSCRGIEPIEIGTYRDACELGVAPAPTNAVQKAIWDEVHRLPTEPIVIKPETKPVK